MAYRVFLSSPSDLTPEREIVTRVIQRMNAEADGEDVFELFRWEDRYYSAAETFQRQMPRPGECDLVICLFWKILGTDLPPEYLRPDGSLPTGSEFEFEDALTTAEASEDGLPDILVYRKTAEVLFSAERLEMQRAQYERFRMFWRRWFYSEQGHFLAAFHSFQTPEEFEAQVADHLRQWLANRSGEVAWSAGSPYPGLRRFDVEDAPVFFGRRREVERLRARLISATLGGSPFLLVTGASGSGKSSLIRAGLIPRLAASGGLSEVGDMLRWAIATPSELEADWAAGLAAALFDKAALGEELAAGDFEAADALSAVLQAPGPAAAAPVAKALDRAGAERAPPRKAALLILIDQLEEIFAWDPEKAEAFLAGVAGLAEASGGRMLVVGAMRSDFQHRIGELLSLERLSGRAELKRPEAAERTIEIAPIRPADFREIIQAPARAAGLTFERSADGDRDLAALIEAEAEPGALPAVQHLLRELYERRVDGMMTLAAHEELGGVGGVMARSGESVLEGLDAEAKAALPRLVRALVRIDGGDGPAVARRLSADAFAAGGPEDRLAQAFLDARLLISDERELRLAHESLITGWDRLSAMVAEDRRLLEARERLIAYRRSYAEAGASPEHLLQGFPLAEGRELLAKWGEESLRDSDADLPGFIKASARRDNRRRTMRQAVAWATAAVFAGLSVGLYFFWTEAEAARLKTQASLEIVRAQVAARDGRTVEAATHALAGLELVPSAENRAVALAAMMEISPNLQTIHRPRAPAEAVAFADDGALLVAFEGGRLDRVSAAPDGGGATLGVFARVGSARILKLATLADGRVLAVYDDGALAAMDSAGAVVVREPPAEIGPLAPGRHGVDVVAGEEVSVAAVSQISGLWVGRCGALEGDCDWDSGNWAPDFVAAAAMTGSMTVVAGDATFELTATGPDGLARAALEERAISLGVSADGGLIAAGTDGGELLLFDQRLTLRARSRPSRSTIPILRWSPKAPRLAFVCDDVEICLRRFDGAGETVEVRMTGHVGPVTDIAWSPDGARLASASRDGTVRVWTMTAVPGARMTLDVGRDVRITSLDVDPASGRIAAGDADGAVWVFGDGPPGRLAAPGGGEVRSVAWLDGGRLAAAVGGRRLAIWSDGDVVSDAEAFGAEFSRLARVGDRVAAPLRSGAVAVATADGTVTRLALRPGASGVEGPGPWGVVARPDGSGVLVSYTDGALVSHGLDPDAKVEVLFTGDQTGAKLGAGSLSVSADGAWLAASQGERVVNVYSLKSDGAILRAPVGDADIRVVAFEPGGARLAALSAGGGLHLFRLENGAVTPIADAPAVAARSRAGRKPGGRAAEWLAWTIDGRLAVATSAGEVQLIDLDEAAWRTRVSGLAGKWYAEADRSTTE